MKNKNKYNFVYVSICIPTMKMYIGDHSTNNLNDGYLGSGRPLFKNVLLKYNKENFIRIELEFFDTKQEAFNAQEKYIKLLNTLSPNGYNLSPKGGLNVKNCHSEETKLKMSKSAIGKKMSDECREKTRQRFKGKTWEEIYGKEIANKMKNERKNRKMSEETKLKISNSLKGTVRSYETRLKMSISTSLNPPLSMLGKNHTEETKQKMRHKHKKNIII